MRLLDLSIAEFNDSLGKIILYTCKGSLKTEDFKALDEVLLPKDQLCNKLIAVTVRQRIVMTFPISLRNSCYKRSKYVFGLLFQVKREEFIKDRQIYVNFAKKVTDLFLTLELQNHVLFYNRLSEIGPLLQQIFKDFNQQSVVFLSKHQPLSIFPKLLRSQLPQLKPFQILTKVSQISNPVLRGVQKLLQKGITTVSRLQQQIQQGSFQHLKRAVCKNQIQVNSYFDLDNKYVLLNPKGLFKALASNFSEFKKGDDEQSQLIKVAGQFVLGLQKDRSLSQMLRGDVRLMKVKVVKLLRWAQSQKLIRLVREIVLPEKPQFTQIFHSCLEISEPLDKFTQRVRQGVSLEQLALRCSKPKKEIREAARTCGFVVLEM